MMSFNTLTNSSFNLQLSPPAQKWGILSFQHIFLFSFLQLHKRVSIKILQKRITEIHSELLPKSYSQSIISQGGFYEKKLRFSRKTKKMRFLETRVAENGGRKAGRKPNSELLHSNIDQGPAISLLPPTLAPSQQWWLRKRNRPASGLPKCGQRR